MKDVTLNLLVFNYFYCDIIAVSFVIFMQDLKTGPDQTCHDIYVRIKNKPHKAYKGKVRINP